MDKTGISRNAYRELASVQLGLLRDHLISSARQDLDEKMREICPITVVNKSFTMENNIEESLVSASRSLRDLLPLVLRKVKDQLTGGETIKVKVAGDGRNVGRKRKHVMVVFCVFKEGAMVLRPSSQYTLNLIVGSEDYELMKKALASFVEDLTFIQENGVYRNGDQFIVTDSPKRSWVHYPVDFYFSSDWKFLVICQGLNAANSEVFCIWCHCSKEEIRDMTREWKIVRTLDEARKYLAMRKDKRKGKQLSEEKKASSVEVLFFVSFIHFFLYF